MASLLLCRHVLLTDFGRHMWTDDVYVGPITVHVQANPLRKSKPGIMHGNGKFRAPITKKTTMTTTKPNRLRRTSPPPPPPPPPPATCTVCGDDFREERFWEEDVFIIEDTVPLLSVIATLICGHLYHVKCLERFAPFESNSDPSCPFCEFLEEEKQRNNLRPVEVSAGGKPRPDTEIVSSKSGKGKSLENGKEREESSVIISAKSTIRGKRIMNQPQGVLKNPPIIKPVERKKTGVAVVQKNPKPMSKSSSTDETAVQRKPMSKLSGVEPFRNKPISQLPSIGAVQKKTNVEAVRKKTLVEVVQKKTGAEVAQDKNRVVVEEEQKKNCIRACAASSRPCRGSTSTAVAESSKRIRERYVSIMEKTNAKERPPREVRKPMRF
ncbi:hypothetical protein H6P81_000384 [Aristolochia fimbriata]|uniref:RING-type domain-containing protein n=1 Tax=Aristolochia fimbriata TaxID=158543 RepID=A0AAV7F6Z7_ARIFI|nr:hypothetical protein H6P81_000384 [Aristolochia fimbriata]